MPQDIGGWPSWPITTYNEIQYKSGKNNIDADRLSRVQWPEVVPQGITCQSVAACLEGVQVHNALIEAVACPQPLDL